MGHFKIHQAPSKLAESERMRCDGEDSDDDESDVEEKVLPKSKRVGRKKSTKEAPDEF